MMNLPALAASLEFCIYGLVWASCSIATFRCAHSDEPGSMSAVSLQVALSVIVGMMLAGLSDNIPVMETVLHLPEMTVVRSLGCVVLAIELLYVAKRVNTGIVPVMLVTAAFPSSSVVYQFMAAVSMLLVYQQVDSLEGEDTRLKGAGGAG
ncbi:hypothetical protein GUITHDRAFT_99597 [Guillardia theta CCMP2712]|uniref:Uncharacterized protein n=1 Tax=Guillardia theta (strain CCMP2712) TaxID=905079 RepID=L1K3K9_GUITC|nr:hypothetical protein GUITHDRAFT_99597 [Guillardia theta CCMP2712]EKX54948.1 hypothetical protein GUITHDRAFT_99597 [Guillardia theta CCMP2712]|eukprot:XP_005841928.1 hypothetical protein GUITHDRAFT_99597 [Guillardia theta CCMP2712]